MDKLTPISAPLGRRWREFRVEYMPKIAFALSVLAAVVLWEEFAVPQRADKPTSDAVETSFQVPIESGHATFATVTKFPVGSLTNSTLSDYGD